MAKIERIERMLVAWAQAVTVGDGSGFPTKSVLHPSWSPPSGGVLPAMKAQVSGSARRTHRLLASVLTGKQLAAVVAHYCIKGTMAHQAQLLDCAEATVVLRVEAAHAALAVALDEGVIAT